MNVGHRAIFTTELVARSIKNELSTSCRRILSLVHGAAVEAIAGTESLEDECFPGMLGFEAPHGGAGSCRAFKCPAF